MLIGARPTLGRNEDERRSCRSPGRDRRHGTSAGATCAGTLSAATDAWLVALYDAARDEHPRAPQAALLAIGGYGRGELAPFSDLDLLLVHTSTPARVEPFASAIWYPLWDAGSKLGHAVRTVDDQVDLAKSDLDTATALLTARLIAGDATLAAKVIDAGRSNWTKHSKRWLGELQLRVARTPTGCRRGGVHARARLEGRPRWPARRAVAVVGGAGRSGVAERRRRRARRVLRHAGASAGRAAPRDRPGRATSLRLEDQDAAAAAVRARHRRRADGRRRRRRRERSRGSPTRRGAGSSARSVASPIASPPA